MNHFNRQAATYARYRPTYPAELAAKLAALVRYRGVCWDVGTGTGQMALLMAKHFNLVCATDIGVDSLKHAPGHKGILYSCQPAEQTDFPNEFFDLVVAAQAAHWFRLPEFYSEVRRTARPGAAVAILGYGRPILPPAVQDIYHQLEYDLLGPYWAPEVQLLDDGYRTIDFPFDPLEFEFPVLQLQWTLEHLTGFMNSWSATQNLLQAGGHEVWENAMQKLQSAWANKDKPMQVAFPLLGRIGRV